jgi:hypothetical protein
MRYHIFSLLVVLVSGSSFASETIGRGVSMCQEFGGCDTKERKDAVTMEPARKKLRQTEESEDRVSRSRSAPIRNEEPSNLPKYYNGSSRSSGEQNLDGLFVDVEPKPTPLKGVLLGDVFGAVLEQSIKASPGVPTPIRVQVTSGRLKGGMFVGKATLDRELKRVLLDFDRVRPPNMEKVYVVKATGLNLSGQIGLEGDHHSMSDKYFLYEMASATAAGFADSTITRTQNNQGNYVTEPSLSNSAKAGAVTALSRTAERAADAVRQAPEWTEIPAFQEIQVMIQEDPSTTAGG